MNNNYGLTPELLEQYSNNNSSTGNREYAVNPFKLADGETAIVRFLVDDMSDLQLITSHTDLEWDDKKYQRIHCLRGPKDDMSVCPLCRAGSKTASRIYIRMIQYITDPNTGEVTAKAKIWDRSVTSDFVTNLLTYLNEYGPLSDIICSISRKGKTVSDTVYTISPNLPPVKYPPDRYVKDFSTFDNYKIVGGLVRDWSYEDMNNFIVTGKPPVRTNNKSITSTPITPSTPEFTAPSNVPDSSELPFT